MLYMVLLCDCFFRNYGGKAMTSTSDDRDCRRCGEMDHDLLDC